DPSTWGTYDLAHERFLADDGALDGVGFVFSDSDPFTGVDLDGCLDPATGRLDAWAEGIVTDFRTYTEVSPSGHGVTLFVKGTLPVPGKHLGNIEVYFSRRFFTVTRRQLPDTHPTIEPRQAELLKLYQRLTSAKKEMTVVCPQTWCASLDNDAGLSR